MEGAAVGCKLGGADLLFSSYGELLLSFELKGESEGGSSPFGLDRTGIDSVLIKTSGVNLGESR